MLLALVERHTWLLTKSLPPHFITRFLTFDLMLRRWLLLASRWLASFGRNFGGIHLFKFPKIKTVVKLFKRILAKCPAMLLWASVRT
jgi:hypothetical protein